MLLWAPRGGGLSDKKDWCARTTFRLQKAVLELLRVLKSSAGVFAVLLGYEAEKIWQEIICCLRIISWGWKHFQATPTKQDLVSCKGSFSKSPTSTPVLYLGVPQTTCIKNAFRKVDFRQERRSIALEKTFDGKRTNFKLNHMNPRRNVNRKKKVKPWSWLAHSCRSLSPLAYPCLYVLGHLL